MTATLISADRAWQQVLDRDVGADSEFVYAVRTTGIYCRPSCPSRRPRRDRVEFFVDPRLAEEAGYRPCRRCNPADPENAGSSVAARVQEALRLNPDHHTVESLAQQLGVTAQHIGRAFKRETGTTLRSYVKERRTARWREAIRSQPTLSRAVYEAGFGSPSRAYEGSEKKLGMTPGKYRAKGEGMQIEVSSTTTSLGKLVVAGTDRGICAVKIGDDPGAMMAELREEFSAADFRSSSPDFEDLVGEVVSRVEGAPPRRNIPVDVQATAFRLRVWDALTRIPVGETRSYQQLAADVGSPKGTRAVASACAQNPVAVVIPCHRVIRSDGSLGGYRWGPKRKEQLLERERGGAVRR